VTKIVCRKAKLDDIPAIVDIAVESVSRDPLPVKINREAMADTARTCLNPAHFMWVAEQDGKVVASVAACVQESFWFSKLQCSVLLYYTRVPGAGLPLMREFARWVKSRSAIKVAVMELEPDADPRLVKFLKRLGFARESLNLTYVRSAA
jgi:N-acetylglutamate synthase-like GNAT family acetyltransferase